MVKKGKQKQVGQSATPEQAPSMSQPPVDTSKEKEKENVGFGDLTAPSADAWGMDGVEFAHDEGNDEIKPVFVKTPSVSASDMLSNANSKAAQAERASMLASALASSIKMQAGGEKNTTGATTGKGEPSKPETATKSTVTWVDGGWDDNPPGQEHSRSKAMWEDDQHYSQDGDDWGGEGEDEELEDDQGGPSSGTGWPHERPDWTHITSASQQWPLPAPPPPEPQPPAKASWMSWRDEAQKLAKSYSAHGQHQVSTDPYATWGHTSSGGHVWNEAGPSTKPMEQHRQPWYSTSPKPGSSQHQAAWTNVQNDGYSRRPESAWYTTNPKMEQKKTQKPPAQSDRSGKVGKKGKKDKEGRTHRRGRSPTRHSGDAWGERRDDTWNMTDDLGNTDRWGNNDDWGRDDQQWGNGGGGWGAAEKDWNKDGDEWNDGGGGWDTGEGNWDDRGKDNGGDWGYSRDDDDDDETWNRRVHFTPKSTGSVPLGPTYTMPSKTMAHAYSSLPSDFPRGQVANSMNEYADVHFVESKGAALGPVKSALFGTARMAKDRIHWLFPSDKDERVASLVYWIQKVSYGLAGFGLHKFLQTRERGALFSNADYSPDKQPNQPAFDWLTFDQLQATRDRTLQESVAFYDPAVQVIVFIFLPSKSGNSVAMWRRKLKVPNNLRLAYQREISLAMATLRKDKDYVLHVDEIPNKKDGRRASLPAKKPQDGRPKRKWWQIFG